MQKRFVNILCQADKEAQKNQDFFVSLTLRQPVPNYMRHHSVHLTPTKVARVKLTCIE